VNEESGWVDRYLVYEMHAGLVNWWLCDVNRSVFTVSKLSGNDLLKEDGFVATFAGELLSHRPVVAKTAV